MMPKILKYINKWSADENIEKDLFQKGKKIENMKIIPEESDSDLETYEVI